MNGNEQLTAGSIVSNGFKIGFQNYGRVVLTLLLFALTCWIPYLNIGIAIGFTGLIIILAKGRKISPVDMFDGYYFKKMGDFALLKFLTWGGMFATIFILFSAGGIFAAFSALVPMVILSYSWMIAGPLCLDKDLDPIKSIYLSNKLTYGKKGTLFGGMILLILCFSGMFILFMLLFWGLGYLLLDGGGYGAGFYNNWGLYWAFIILFYIIAFLLVSLVSSITLGAYAFIYRSLAPNDLKSYAIYFEKQDISST